MARQLNSKHIKRGEKKENQWSGGRVMGSQDTYCYYSSLNCKNPSNVKKQTLHLHQPWEKTPTRTALIWDADLAVHLRIVLKICGVELKETLYAL